MEISRNIPRVSRGGFTNNVEMFRELRAKVDTGLKLSMAWLYCPFNLLPNDRFPFDQVTFQACNIDEARLLYDQLAGPGPIMVRIIFYNNVVIF